MIDSFALMGEPRRPWLDAEELRGKFLRFSAAAHPDRHREAAPEARAGAQDHYAEMNAAYQRLRNPRDRLKHLVELESGARVTDVQQVPAELMDRFLEVGQLCAEADRWLARGAGNSALLRAERFEAAQELSARLLKLNDHLGAWEEELQGRLRSLDRQWTSLGTGGDRAAVVAEMADLSRLYGFCARWTAQVRERLVRLAGE